MSNKFWNKITISALAGVLAYAVTILVLFIPTKGEVQMSRVDWYSPLGILVISLFVVSIIFYVVSIVKSEKHLSYQDMKALVEKRKEYLEPLKTIIKERLTRTDCLIKIASEFPLEEYRKKYAPLFKVKKAIGIYSWIFVKQKFMIDNLHYDLLKQNDAKYRELVQEYKFLYSQIKDRKLKKLLNGLWTFERTCNSINIFALLSIVVYIHLG